MLVLLLQEAQESSGTVNNTARAAATANKTTEQIVDVRRAQVRTYLRKYSDSSCGTVGHQRL